MGGEFFGGGRGMGGLFHFSALLRSEEEELQLARRG